MLFLKSDKFANENKISELKEKIKSLINEKDLNVLKAIVPEKRESYISLCMNDDKLNELIKEYKELARENDLLEQKIDEKAYELEEKYNDLEVKEEKEKEYNEPDNESDYEKN